MSTVFGPSPEAVPPEEEGAFPFCVMLLRPYYPSAEMARTLEEAHAIRDRILAEDHEEDGIHSGAVLIAEAREWVRIRTHY